MRVVLLLLPLLLLSCASTPPKKRSKKARIDDETAAEVAPKPKAIDPQKRISVHLLDVGQGAATLIELPCGALLVDTGGEQNEAFDGVAQLEKQLDAFFGTRPDLDRTLGLVVITHPHIDHVRGLPMLLSKFKVAAVVDNGLPGDDLVKEPLAAIASSGVVHKALKNSDIVKKNGYVDDVVDPFACSAVDPQVRVLQASFDSDPGWGSDDYGKKHFDDMNNHSVVVRVDAGNASVLITGDLEEPAIAELLKRYEGTRWLDVDVLQVGHHGSANGTTPALLKATTPLVALIGAGPSSRQQPWTAWQYGHPRENVVAMLQRSVGMGREPQPVTVAKGMKKFATTVIDHAIYSIGWDGPVVVDLGVDGEVQVRDR